MLQKRQHLSTVSDMRQFVSDELRGLRHQHKGLTIRMLIYYNLINDILRALEKDTSLIVK